MKEEILWNKVLEQLDRIMKTDYDPAVGLLGQKAKGINYHTSISAGLTHSTRENLSWLPALLKRGYHEDYGRAFSIISRVLALQDKQKENETYGVWPYLFEEPLTQMKNPDWNWAAFLGGSLITLLKEFREVIPEALVRDMEEALIRACESIIRRNMGVDYTNISLMSAFVLVLAGEITGREEFSRKGCRILEAQLDFVVKNGGFAEYNSPTYGVLDIEETGKILKYSGSEEARRLAYQLHGLSWKVFAEHYHYSTGQVAPPHARCYADIQDNVIRTLITVGTEGECRLEEEENWSVSLMWPFMTLQCPEEFRKFFVPQKEPRIQEEEFYKGIDTIEEDQVRVLIEKGTPPLTSYTWLHPDYCLGTFKNHDMWNQRRPLMAYFATAAGTACFRVRCLHDDMDFSGAVMHTVQQKGAAAGGISFVTDHGDYHYILTPIPDEGITAERITVDFIVEGALDEVRVTGEKKSAENSNATWRFQIGRDIMYLTILKAAFGEETVRIEEIDTNESKGIRLVLYGGEKQKIDLKQIEKAYAAFWLEITDHSDSDSPVTGGTVREEGESLAVSLDTGNGKCLETRLLQKPGRYMQPIQGMIKEFKYGGFTYHFE